MRHDLNTKVTVWSHPISLVTAGGCQAQELPRDWLWTLILGLFIFFYFDVFVNYCSTVFYATLCFNMTSNTLPNFLSLYKQWKEWHHYLSEKDKPKKTNKKCAEVSLREAKFMFITFADLLSALTSCNSLEQLLLCFIFAPPQTSEATKSTRADPYGQMESHGYKLNRLFFAISIPYRDGIERCW